MGAGLPCKPRRRLTRVPARGPQFQHQIGGDLIQQHGGVSVKQPQAMDSSCHSYRRCPTSTDGVAASGKSPDNAASIPTSAAASRCPFPGDAAGLQRDLFPFRCPARAGMLFQPMQVRRSRSVSPPRAADGHRTPVSTADLDPGRTNTVLLPHTGAAHQRDLLPLFRGHGKI